MVYTRGSNDEYDRWAEITQDQSWAWKNLEKYYLKVLTPLITEWRIAEMAIPCRALVWSLQKPAATRQVLSIRRSTALVRSK